MKKLTLIQEQNKKGFTYKVYENDTLLCQRKSLREYVACYVVYEQIRKNDQVIWEYNAHFLCLFTCT